MDQTLLLALVGASVVGIVAVIVILAAQDRRARANRDRPFATSTEGETRCPACGMGNLATDNRCIACGARLA